MTRNAVNSAAITLAASVSVLVASCGGSDRTPLGNKDQESSLLDAAEMCADLSSWADIAVFVAIEEEKHVSSMLDARTSRIVLSLLTESARERLAAVGLVCIGDEETAVAIGNAAALKCSRASGVWVGLEASWGCIKCCFAAPACAGCNPCPACCEDKDGYVEMPFEGR